MTNTDLVYLGTTIGNLSGVPIRIYEGERVILQHTMVHLPKDPMEVYKDEIWKIREPVGYFATPIFQYYGILNHGQIRVILGPTRQIPETEQELRELAFLSGVAREEWQAFRDGMRAIARMPVEKLMQILCMLYFYLTGRRLELHDIAIQTREQQQLTRKQLENPRFEEEIPSREHNTMDWEREILTRIRQGKPESLRDLLSSAPAIQAGTLADEPLRQRKNVFVVTATLCSRAAIQGGLGTEEALTLCDEYIQHCELLRTPEKLSNLQYRMLMDYADRVGRLHWGESPSKLVLDAAGYVRQHISQKITVQEIADRLFVSRPYLSAKFSEETGQTLTQYILSEKVEEGKRLLCFTEKSVTDISLYLGFSSPSHFARTFSSCVGITPSQYRNKSGMELPEKELERQ